jgi:predicted AAA+ superfamily ATPase
MRLETEMKTMKDDVIGLSESLERKIENNQTSIMALLQPLHDASMKQAGFLRGVIFGGGALIAVIGWAVEHLAGYFKMQP